MCPVRPPDESNVMPSGEDQEAGEGAEEEEEQEEEVECKVCKDPGEPSQQERDEHDVTHLPYRPWCRVCVEAKGKEDPHRRVDQERKENGVPVISLDYAFMGQEGQEGHTKIIVMKDNRTKMTFCHVTEKK